MKVLYKWTKKHNPKISPPVDYRYITYDDTHEKDYTIKCITLEYKRGGSWTPHCDYSGYTEVLNILRLIEDTTGKKIKGSYT